jgi:hypothetical protein
MVIVPMVIPLTQSWDSQRMAGIKTRFFRCAQNVSWTADDSIFTLYLPVAVPALNKMFSELPRAQLGGLLYPLSTRPLPTRVICARSRLEHFEVMSPSNWDDSFILRL